MNSHFASLITSIFLISCASNPQYSQCSPAGSKSTYSNGDYVVHVYGGNDAENPDLWEGPICIDNVSEAKSCSVDLSLIKSVSLKEDGYALNVQVFSGSVMQSVAVNMEDCSTNYRYKYRARGDICPL